MNDENQKEEAKQKGSEEPSQTSQSLELESLRVSLKECQEKYVRLLAESENARKRLIKEGDEHMQFALERLIVEFLQPLDHFEKALKFAENMSEDVKNWAIGFEMILGQFKQVIAGYGVTPFDSLGKHFDPHLHEPVEVVEEAEYPDGTIIEEYLKGYRKGERIVRVARVKVSKKPSPKGPNLEEKK